MENEILMIAKQLAEQGKKPTVALIKAKLSQRVAMPIIIQALQRFDALNAKERKDLQKIQETETETQAPQSDIPQQIALLQQEVASLKQQVAQLTTLVEELNSKGTKR